MQQNNDQEQREPNTSPNRKIFFIISVYLFITFTTHFSQRKQTNQDNLVGLIKSNNADVKITELISFFELDEYYEGYWSKKVGQNKAQNEFLSEKSGKFEIKMIRSSSSTAEAVFTVFLVVYNGDFIDKGLMSLQYAIKNNMFEASRPKNESITMSLLRLTQNQTGSNPQVLYRVQQILKTIDTGFTNHTNLQYTFTIINSNIQVSIQMDLMGIDLELIVQGKEPKMLKMMIFAVVMFIASYCPFSANMNILRNLYDLNDNSKNYSLTTICFTTMWDTVLCLVAFIFAFKDQESLILFIIPAFLLCLLFTNLQPRLMMLIFQSNDNQNISWTICKFNILHYGSLTMIYPILLITNFSPVLFLSMCLIFVPQIYLNAVNGIRPDIKSPYYTKYLLGRFIIVFYLRMFPFNIFRFEPNYFLSFACLVIIALQYGLLAIQKTYGSKKVVPAFLLEPVFNYKCEQQQVNMDEAMQGGECVICLNCIHNDPIQNAGELQFKPAFRLMRTPCNHVYHSQCLLVWMKIKMQCPQCRYKLPPYE